MTNMMRAAELVGRGEEITVLEAALDDTRRSRGSAVFIAGEPGIGKTRLADEALRRAAARGMTVLKGRCTAMGPAVPFRPLAEALLSLARQGVAPSAQALGPYLPVLGRLVPEWSTGEQCDQSPVVLAEAVLRLCIDQGARAGCVLAVDDLHDADPETVAVLEYLAANLADQHVAVVATVRSAPSAALELADAVCQRREGRLLSLGRLARGDARVFAASCLGCPPREVSDAVSARVFTESGGVPFMAEELIRSMVAAERLLPRDGVWQLSGADRSGVPFTLVRAIEQRAARLGPDGARLLSAAAVFGRHFPLPVLRRCVGLDGQTLLKYLSAAVAEGLLLADERGPDWYAFEHPLTEEALLSSLAPLDRMDLSERAADAVEALYPGLPGTWCHLAARLRRRAGDHGAAALLYLETARRALAGSGPVTAIAVLDEALHMLDQEARDGAHQAAYPELLEVLLLALADDGRFDRAALIADRLRRVDAVVDPAQRIGLHVRLAWAAQVAGRWEEGVRQVAAARSLLPPDAAESRTARIDAVEAYLAVSSPEHGRIGGSEALARSAIKGAVLLKDDALACQGWYAVGFASRRRSLDESDDCFRRTLEIAAAGNLVTWRNHGLIGLGNNAWLAEADRAPLEYAHYEALRTGCVSLAHNAGASLAFDTVLRSEFDRATALLDDSLAETTRLKLHSITRYLLMLRAAVAAHQADRPAMRAALAEFRAHGGERSREAPLAQGLAELFCALLEEDRDTAAELAAGLSTAQPGGESFFHLSGTHGLILLLDTLDGRAAADAVDRIAAGQAGRLRWNRQFVQLARAVHLGRAGRGAEADAALDVALACSEVFPTARHLALRLAADAALADGWGEPRRWLAEAEEYFFRGGVPAAASACRSRLRELGVPVRQRRTGSDLIPRHLRAMGITTREFEVFQLLPSRLGNKALASRLHISARTVEKHIASLLTKTRTADRTRLCDYAADELAPTRPAPTAD